MDIRKMSDLRQFCDDDVTKDVSEHEIEVKINKFLMANKRNFVIFTARERFSTFLLRGKCKSLHNSAWAARLASCKVMMPEKEKSVGFQPCIVPLNIATLLWVHGEWNFLCVYRTCAKIELVLGDFFGSKPETTLGNAKNQFHSKIMNILTETSTV